MRVVVLEDGYVEDVKLLGTGTETSGAARSSGTCSIS
jgi:hypothetical protein